MCHRKCVSAWPEIFLRRDATAQDDQTWYHRRLVQQSEPRREGAFSLKRRSFADMDDE